VPRRDSFSTAVPFKRDLAVQQSRTASRNERELAERIADVSAAFKRRHVGATSTWSARRGIAWRRSDIKQPAVKRSGRTPRGNPPSTVDGGGRGSERGAQNGSNEIRVKQRDLGTLLDRLAQGCPHQLDQQVRLSALLLRPLRQIDLRLQGGGRGRSQLERDVRTANGKASSLMIDKTRRRDA